MIMASCQVGNGKVDSEKYEQEDHLLDGYIFMYIALMEKNFKWLNFKLSSCEQC